MIYVADETDTDAKPILYTKVVDVPFIVSAFA